MFSCYVYNFLTLFSRLALLITILITLLLAHQYKSGISVWHVRPIASQAPAAGAMDANCFVCHVEMDVVPYVSFLPIKSGTTFTYEFPRRQSGTYWYHSHTSLQEQSGVYGSIAIEPRGEGLKPDHDYVVLLSDWVEDNPHEVNRALKRGSERYEIQKGSTQSILGACRLGMLGDYFKRELQRMPTTSAPGK